MNVPLDLGMSGWSSPLAPAYRKSVRHGFCYEVSVFFWRSNQSAEHYGGVPGPGEK
jgi:hypothetical protein